MPPVKNNFTREKLQQNYTIEKEISPPTPPGPTPAFFENTLDKRLILVNDFVEDTLKDSLISKSTLRRGRISVEKRTVPPRGEPIKVPPRI